MGPPVGSRPGLGDSRNEIIMRVKFCIKSRICGSNSAYEPELYRFFGHHRQTSCSMADNLNSAEMARLVVRISVRGAQLEQRKRVLARSLTWTEVLVLASSTSAPIDHSMVAAAPLYQQHGTPFTTFG